jgi:benzoyl-CoA reductase/2-hydroxyglutaryl-CoA dehydratase subunit BcrC/BadD/HgdB
MADKEKRSLREFLRHINDYTYRFNPEKGQFRYRELRGVRDTAFDFYMWLKCWKDMVVFVAKCPVSAVRALFRYQWFATYLTYPNFVDRGTLGMRGNQLRMARAQYDRIVKKATDLLRISFVADEHFHPGNKLSKKVVLFDELVPGEIMAGFPNLIYLPAQVLPVFLCSILDQQITPPYLDAAENFGIPADVCPLPSAEAGCALRDDYPKLGTCFVACNMPCDGSVATTSYQDRYFNLPTYYFGVPIRYNEEAVQDYAVEELRGLIRFIEEQTGETFDWDAFFRAMKVYNQETEYELQKWEVNRTPYPQMTGETFWIYRMFFYHLSGGMDPHFLDTDRRVNRIMMRGYQQKKPCAPAMRHRCVEWSCPANFYPDFSVWAENCWGINVVASMESLISDIIINTEDQDQALADLARSYQRTTMRKHTKGGYANVLDELWIVCKQYNADMVLMYDQISCKGMDGLRGVFEEQAAARGVHMLWVAQDLLDSRTISKRDMRRQVNLYMQTVMGEEPVRPDLVDFDDALTW